MEDAVAQRELMEAINDFLKTKTDRGERQLFLRRYFGEIPLENSRCSSATVRAR